MESDVKACHDAGMNDYISKPTTLDALKAKIEYWLMADGNLAAADGLPEAAAPATAPADATSEAPLDSQTQHDHAAKRMACDRDAGQVEPSDEGPHYGGVIGNAISLIERLVGIEARDDMVAIPPGVLGEDVVRGADDRRAERGLYRLGSECL